MDASLTWGNHRTLNIHLLAYKQNHQRNSGKFRLKTHVSPRWFPHLEGSAASQARLVCGGQVRACVCVCVLPGDIAASGKMEMVIRAWSWQVFTLYPVADGEHGNRFGLAVVGGG